MWLLFLPFMFVIAALLLVGSLVAGLISIFGAAWPVLLIGLGVWMFWHQDGRHADRGARQGWTPTASGEPPDTAIADPASDSRRQDRKRRKADVRAEASGLPIDIRVKVEQIRRKVEVMLGYADRFPPFSKDLYLVRQTAAEYLPRTISAYLALPPHTIDQPLATGGRTAHQELKAQLDLLDARLDDIAQDLQRQDTDRLLANRLFLEDRFGRRNGGIGVAAEPPARATT